MKTIEQCPLRTSNVLVAIFACVFAVLPPATAVPPVHTYGHGKCFHSGSCEAWIINQSKKNGDGAIREREESERQAARDKREQELKEAVEQDRQKRKEQWRQENEAAERRQQEWRDKQRQQEAEQKARDAERAEQYRIQQENFRRQQQENIEAVRKAFEKKR